MFDLMNVTPVRAFTEDCSEARPYRRVGAIGASAQLQPATVFLLHPVKPWVTARIDCPSL